MNHILKQSKMTLLVLAGPARNPIKKASCYENRLERDLGIITITQ